MQSYHGLTSLYNLALRSVIESKTFHVRDIRDLPVYVKEDLLRVALLRGKGRGHVSYFLHPNISKLIINDSRISESDLENISRCGRLRVLEMNPAKHYRFNHPSVTLERMFCSLRHLARLHIQRNDGVTDHVVESLTTSCRGLQELDVSGCVILTDRAAQAVSTLACLRVLDLSATRVTDSGLTALAEGHSSRSLMELSLNRCLEVTDVGINALVGTCESITILTLSGCPKISVDCQLALSTFLGSGKKSQLLFYTLYF